MWHWFDSLCMRLAGEERADSLPRRDFMRGVLSGFAVGAVDSGRVLWAQTGQATGLRAGTGIQSRLPSPAAIPLGDQCKRSWSGNVLTQGVLVSQNGVSYQRTLAYDRAARTVTDAVTVTQGSTAVVSVQVTTQSNGASTANVTYGPAISGAHTATLTSTDGKRLAGTVDGRQITSAINATAAPVIEFLDHRPAPAIAPIASLANSLSATVGALGKLARTRFNSCQTMVSTTSTRGPVRVMDYKPGGGGPNDPGDGWYEPGGTYSSPDCDNCWNNCEGTAEKYSGLDDWQTYLCPPCLAAAVFSFNAIWLVCWGTCQLPGGGCCPVPCGGVFTCCGRDDNCFRGDLCCPQSMVVCNNVCCGSNIHVCASDGTCGCPDGMTSCGENCCPSGQICCGGLCTAPNGCDNGCATPTHFCNGTCCAAFNSCCNGRCCGQTCVNNVCCPPAQVCGNVCCAAGQVCSNGTCFGCPSSRLTIKSIPCQSMGQNGVMVGTCCSVTAPTCCGGVCCGIGYPYCANVNGTLTCSKSNPVVIK